STAKPIAMATVTAIESAASRFSITGSEAAGPIGGAVVAGGTRAAVAAGATGGIAGAGGGIAAEDVVISGVMIFFLSFLGHGYWPGAGSKCRLGVKPHLNEVSTKPLF